MSFFTCTLLVVAAGSLWAGASWGWLRSFSVAGTRSWTEWLLIGVVPLMGLGAYWPFAYNGLIGAGDSYHYSLQVADAVTQARQGEWPIISGQSLYAFNGNVHTVRTAPYFTHLAALLDFLTGQKLAFWQLTHLILLGSGALAAWLAYLSARWLAPQAWLLAALLAALYVLSPALATPLINHDMYATFVAVPWLPLVCASAVQCWRNRGLTPWMLLAFSLGLTWLAHPPIAIWITPLAAAAVAIAVVKNPLRSTAVRGIAAALLFSTLAGYVAYSVSTLHVPGDIRQTIDPGTGLVSGLLAAWPDSWKPLDLTVTTSGSIQLGYGLWSAILISCVTLFLIRRNAAGWFYLGCFTALLCFVAPLPHLTPWLWAQIPSEVKVITNAWPAQRLYPILAAVGIALSAVALGEVGLKKSAMNKAVLSLVAVGVLWSVWEFRKLDAHALKMRRPTAESASVYEPGTMVLGRSSYALFSTTPAYYSHGWMDPEFESRLLGEDGKISLTNTGFVENAAKAAGSPPIAVPLDVAFPLEITADTDYLFVFTFPSPETAGEVTFLGPGLSRSYALPHSGENASFGSSPTSEHAVRLGCSVLGTQHFAVHAPPGTTITALRFARAVLPIQLHHLYPFRATVSAPSTGYLETPRVFIPGYRARVNGQRVQPVHSAEGLVAIPVPAGTSQVELKYIGPPGLKAFGWLATGAVLLGIVVLIRGPRNDSVRAYTPPTPPPLTRESVSLEAATASERTRVVVSLTLLTVVLVGYNLIAAVRRSPPTHGHVRLAVQFPSSPTAAIEPLVVTGKAGAADALYVVYGEQTFQLGLDHWGGGGPLSEPIPLGYIHRYIIDYESSALQLGAKPPSNCRVRVRLDGRMVLDQDLPTHPPARNEFYLGKNPVGASGCAETFSGWVERMPD